MKKYTVKVYGTAVVCTTHTVVAASPAKALELLDDAHPLAAGEVWESVTEPQESLSEDSRYEVEELEAMPCNWTKGMRPR